MVARVGSYTPHALADSIDAVLHSATRLDVDLRISAAELASSLKALQADPRGPAEIEPASEAALAQLATFLRPTRDEAARREALLDRIDDLEAKVLEQLEVMWRRLEQVTDFETSLADQALLEWRTLTDEIGTPEVLALVDRGYTALGPDDTAGWRLTGGIAMELLADGTLRILGIHGVLRLGVMGYTEVFRTEDELEIMSTRAVDSVAAAAQSTAAQLEPALVAWSEALAEDSS